MSPESFQLPVGFDLLATFFFGLTGALVGIRRGYDIVGVSALALICGVGGSVIRDGIFLQQGPPAVALDARYLYAIGVGILVGLIVRDIITREEPLVFRPGQFYVLAAALGATIFVVLAYRPWIPATAAGLAAIGCALTVRVLSILFNLKTRTFYAPKPAVPPGSPPAAT